MGNGTKHGTILAYPSTYPENYPGTPVGYGHQKSTVLAKGDNVYPKLLNLNLTPFKNQYAKIKPMTMFADGKNNHIIFVTYQVPMSVIFYQSVDNTLRSEVDIAFLRRIYLGAFTKGVLTASWTVPTYKALVYFAIALTPGKLTPIIKAGINLISLANFWIKHQKEIEKTLSTIINLIKSLRKIYSKYPTLCLLMLGVAIQQSYHNVNNQKQQKGIVNLVVSNLDLSKSLYDIADFFGSLLKSKLFPSGSSIAAWVAKKGLMKLANVVWQLHKIYKQYKLFQKGKRAATPKTADPQVLIAKFIRIFAQSGVKLTKGEKILLAKELNADLSGLENLKLIGKYSKDIEKHIVNLTNAANREIFLP